MSAAVYKKLARHLDQLPNGYPATDSGVELRILERLFSPEEAELAMLLSPRLEPAAKIAARNGLTEADLEDKLKALAGKGLVFSIESGDRPAMFMAAPFVVGIWEYHVNDLDEGLIADMHEYLPHLGREAFDVVPQLRTVPVGRSIDPGLRVTSYEQAEEMVKPQTKFLVAPCICRREKEITGQDYCGKLSEACLMFGWAAEYYHRNGLGRMISREEALDILKQADQEGLVLQPSNAEQIVNICCCCGDCCQVLLHAKRHPRPAEVIASPFVIKADPDACTGCETCLDRCQMEALSLVDDRVVAAPERCIGCGLCVSTCPGGALELVRKPGRVDPPPKNMVEAMSLRAKARAELKDKLDRHQALDR